MGMIEERNYRNDPRVRALEYNESSLFKSVDEQKMTGIIVLIDDDGDDEVEVEHEVPVKFEVCDICDGRGHHVNPSIDSNGLTADDFAEDPEFLEEYHRGSYDVECYGCKGKRVALVIDEDRADPEVMKKLHKKWEDEANYRREREAERRFGC